MHIINIIYLLLSILTIVKAFAPGRLKGFRYIESTGSEDMYTYPEDMRYLESLETRLQESFDFRYDEYFTPTPTYNISENVKDDLFLIISTGVLIVFFVVCILVYFKVI
jgi:hypothetical protein